jgi:hypothetical protein
VATLCSALPQEPSGGQASVAEKITAASFVVKGNLNLKERWRNEKEVGCDS